MAIDIVCGKQVDTSTGVDAQVGTVRAGAVQTDPSRGTKRFYEGAWYYFCSLKCRQQFVATPDDVLAKAKGSGYIQ